MRCGKRRFHAISGNSDTAASFNDTSTSNVSIPDSSSLDITKQLTLECWINYSMADGSTGGAPGILTKDDGYLVRGYGLYIAYGSNQDLEFALDVGGSSAVLATSGGGYNDGQWHHVVATYDGSTMCLYVDGSLVAHRTASGNIATNTDPLMIGSFDGARTDSDFMGKIDEAAVYNYALSAAQISQHYAAGMGSFQMPHSHYTYDPNGNELTETDPNGNTTSFTYDEQNRELSRTLPDGQRESFTYDSFGRQSVHVDFDDQATKDTYVASGPHAGLLDVEYRYVAGVNPATGQASEKSVYAYDNLGRQSEVDEYTWNATSSSWQDTRTEATTYDPVTQQVASITSPEGIILYDYDPVTGHLVRTRAEHGTTITEETDYGYDFRGRLTDVYIVQLQGGTPTATFDGLDSSGNPTFTGGTPPDTHYTYDGVGNLATEADPNGVTTTYAYDDLNRLTEVQVKNTANSHLIFDQTYSIDDNGQRGGDVEKRYDSSGTLFSQVALTWKYDADGKLTEEALSVTSGGSNAPAPYDDKFFFDLAGNRTLEEIDEGNDGTVDANITYTYNGNDELLTETRTGDGAYTILYGHLDTNGSLVSGYDANGSLIEQNESQIVSGTLVTTHTTYAYDFRNRMIGVTSGGVTTTYGYDSNGVRVSETTTSGGAFYLNDPQNPTGNAKAIEESSSLNSTTISRAYVFGNAIIAQKDSTNDILYLMHDGHGSTRAVIDKNAAVIERYDYDAYGTLLASTGGQSDAGAAKTQWLFANDGVYDATTGWRYNLARYVDGFHFTQMDIPGQGSNSDPISLHWYLYAKADPILLLDPSGHGIVGELAGNFIRTTLAAIPSVVKTMAALGAIGAIGFGTASKLAGGSFWLGASYGGESGVALGYIFATNKAGFPKALLASSLSGIVSMLSECLADEATGRDISANNVVNAFETGFSSYAVGEAFGTKIFGANPILDFKGKLVKECTEGAIQALSTFISDKRSGESWKEALIDATAQFAFALLFNFTTKAVPTPSNAAGRMVPRDLKETNELVKWGLGFIWGTDLGTWLKEEFGGI